MVVKRRSPGRPAARAILRPGHRPGHAHATDENTPHPQGDTACDPGLPVSDQRRRRTTSGSRWRFGIRRGTGWAGSTSQGASALGGRFRWIDRAAGSASTAGADRVWCW